jgi:hypothetical protein
VYTKVSQETVLQTVYPKSEQKYGGPVMKLYAVRSIDDQEPVGFFWEQNLGNLAYTVDDLIDSSECEYLLIEEPAAIVWESTIGWQMGEKDPTLTSTRSLDWDRYQLLREEREKTIKATVDFFCDTADAFAPFVCGMDKVDGWKPFVRAKNRLVRTSDGGGRKSG